MVKLVVVAARWLLRRLFRVEVKGLEHYQAAGTRVLIVANHTSFLDAVLLTLFLPDRLTFAVNTWVSQHWLLRFVGRFVDLFPMDPTNPLSTRSMIQYLRDDRRAVIFPEGRITLTGSLMKVYDGPGLIADKSGATVLPIRIEGAQYTFFSRLKGRVRIRYFPKIKLIILPPRKLSLKSDLSSRERRRQAARMLADLMTEMMFVSSERDITLMRALCEAQQVHGGRHRIVEDTQRKSLNYRRLLSGVVIMSNKLRPMLGDTSYVGVLMPNSVSTVVGFFALQHLNKIPAMLNYTVGEQGLLAACHTAEIKYVLTSRRFVELAQLQEAVDKLAERHSVIYLEDHFANVSGWQKVSAYLSSYLLAWQHRHRPCHQRASKAAVVLFTSGSEGTPKGVVLSHKNLISNWRQLSAKVDFNSQDVALNALPMFHSFGLSAGTLLPLFSGIKVFLYPTPLHYRIIPEVSYDINATLLFGTNSFLSGYAKHAHPYDFYSVRYVFAGAEKLKDEVKSVWQERFGVRIFEGYGATETSPVLATNTAMEGQAGSVGRFLPGIVWQLQDVPGIDEGGRLFVKGPNIMQGYLRYERPGFIQPPSDEYGEGWYDTGDIVSVDESGFIRILGRAKRFAKIGGEMISLTVVESLAGRTWPDGQHAVIALNDPRKGERLLLLTTCQDIERKALLEQAQQEGLSELNVPKSIETVESLPLLGTGKVDYAELMRRYQGE